MKKLEIDNGDLARYIRRNNVEISGIPDIFKGDVLREI